MDGKNWRAAQAQAQAQTQAQGGGVGGVGAAAGAMDSVDWRTQLLPDYRQRIVNKIMEALERHLPVSGQEGVQELKKIAVRFEEKIYSAATSQQEYLRKISLKMLTMETKSQTRMQPNPTSSGQNSLGPEMTMEATSYEPTSGPEDSDEDAKEEEDGDVSKEDVGEDVVVRKEQNSFVGHTENARIGENEESSSNEAIGRPSVFFK